jgi:hypothetical protein
VCFGLAMGRDGCWDPFACLFVVGERALVVGLGSSRRLDDRGSGVSFVPGSSRSPLFFFPPSSRSSSPIPPYSGWWLLASRLVVAQLVVCVWCLKLQGRFGLQQMYCICGLGIGRFSRGTRLVPNHGVLCRVV